MQLACWLVDSKPKKPQKQCLWARRFRAILLLHLHLCVFLRYLCGFKTNKKKRLYTLVCVPDVFGGLTVWRHNSTKKRDHTLYVSFHIPWWLADLESWRCSDSPKQNKTLHQTLSKSNPRRPGTLEDIETYCSWCILVRFESSEWKLESTMSTLNLKLWTTFNLESNISRQHLINNQFSIPNSTWSYLSKWSGK